MRLLGKSRKKYHGSIMKCYRSIMKYSTILEKSQFKHRKKSVKTSQRAKRILPKNKSYIWALVAHAMGNSCPAHGLQMPTWWAVDARVTGTNRPTEGHRETN